MGLYFIYILVSWFCAFIFLPENSAQDVHSGVDLVTKSAADLMQSLFEEASAQNENVVTSPFGVLSSMAMLMEASTENTKEEVLRALNISTQQVTALRRGFKAYCDLFLLKTEAVYLSGRKNDKLLDIFRGGTIIRFKEETRYLGVIFGRKMTLTPHVNTQIKNTMNIIVAKKKYSSEPEAAGSFNSASFASSFKLNVTFKDLLQKYYCANVSESLPSGGRGKAEKVLDLSSIAGVMSHWKDYEKLAVYTFLSHQSVRPFRKRDGSSVLVPMVPQVGVFRAMQWENSQVVLLPLQSKLVKLLLIVPNKMEEMDSLVKKITGQALPLMLQSAPKQELEVFIPQMAIVNRNLNLTSVLVRNGVVRLFDSNRGELRNVAADGDSKVMVKGVEQNAYFSTSFVALNSVSGVSVPFEVHSRTKRDTKKVYVDRPFLFFVLQKDTQMMLLAGRVENPLQIPN